MPEEKTWLVSQIHVIGRPAPKSWDDYRRGCFATYRGGHEAAMAEAFTHGMGTVFNLMEGEFPPAELCKAAPALLAACKRFEWGGQAYPMDESYQGYANSACPACGGINPNERHMGADSIGAILYDWDDEKYGHADDCVLKAAIEAAEEPD